jgi:hypothetical protein
VSEGVAADAPAVNAAKPPSKDDGVTPPPAGTVLPPANNQGVVALAPVAPLGAAPTIEAVAPPPPLDPAAVAPASGATPLAFEPQQIHKRRARRAATLVAKEDGAVKAAAPKSAARAVTPGPAAKGAKAAAPAPAKAAGKKGKSTWHDPFAD